MARVARDSSESVRQVAYEPVREKLLQAGAKSQYWTVSIGLFNMLEKEYVEVWFVRFCAGAVLVSIPIAILYLLTQKMYQEAMGGAVKG